MTYEKYIDIMTKMNSVSIVNRSMDSKCQILISMSY